MVTIMDTTMAITIAMMAIATTMDLAIQCPPMVQLLPAITKA
jgi:hypothetical protein